MEGLGGSHHHEWNPLAIIGIDNFLLRIHLDTIVTTWCILGFLLCIVVTINYCIKKNYPLVIYSAELYFDSFKDMTQQALGYVHPQHLSFLITIFTFILLCNWVGFIPGCEEPTSDFNTPLALGLIAFLYKEFYTIKEHGFKGYLQEFLTPFFVMLPLNVISHLSKVVSLSFRLFGNIFGGSVITKLWTSALSNSLLWNILGIAPSLIITFFFVFFEGLIQAFVFSMLTITYLGMALQHHEEA